MRQRGRKSAALLAIPAIEAPRPRPEPPPGLTKTERTLFTEIVDTAPHLRPSDASLLASFVQATLMSRRSARDPARIDAWEKATRLQVSLATRLRLSAQSRIDPQTLGRQQPPGPQPWDIHLRGD
jgi:hypothetical protein